MLIDTISLQLYSHTDSWKENGEVFLHDHFFMIRDFSFARKDFLLSTQPYRLQEGRLVIVKQGRANYSFNLVEYEFEAGDVVVFMADTLIEKQGHSPDFVVDCISFDYRSPSSPTIGEGFISLHLNEESREMVYRHFDLLWKMAHINPFPEQNIKMLLNSLLYYIKDQPSHSSSLCPITHREEMNLAANANLSPFNQLCLAPHYLSTLVKQASGRTVMEWINEVAVKEIKVWLAYSNETSAQIAYRLNFPSPSALSKFFKRETGMTPSEYRNNL